MKRYFRPVTLILVVVFLLSLLVSGCQSKSSTGDTESSSQIGNTPANNENETGNKAKKPVTLRFAALDEPGMKNEVAAFKEGFEKENEGVTVQYEPVSGDYTEKILIQASSGELPDVFWTADVWVGSFAKKNIMMELDEWFEKLGVDRNDFYESMMKLGQFDGKQYMIPRDYNHVVTFYNKKLFDESNLEYPKNGWTWDEFVQTARKLVKKQGNDIVQYGAHMLLQWQATMIPALEGFGGSIINDKGNESTLNNPENIKALKTLKALCDEGVIVNSFIQGMPDFNSGKVAMWFSVRPVATGIKQALGDDWDAATFPKMPVKHVQGSGCSGYAVYSKTPNKEEAAKLLMYIVSEKGQEVFMRTGNAVPIRKSLANSEVWRSLPSKDHNQDAYIMFPEADILPLDNRLADSSLGSKVTDVWLGAFERVFLGEGGTVESILEKAHNDLNNVLKGN